MKGFIVFTLILLSLFSLSAKPELWIGANFLADRNMISDSVKENFPNFASGFKHIKSIGPGVEVSFFPFEQFRIGAFAASHTVFPIGYLNSSDGVSGYKIRNMEYRQDLTAGLAYNQLFGSWGFFSTVAYNWSWYKVAKTNVANNKTDPGFNRFSENGITAELGLLAVYDKSYFKFGFSYSHMLSNGGNRIVLFCGGGAKI